MNSSLNKTLFSGLPKLYSQRHVASPRVYFKLRCRAVEMTWLVTEATPEEADNVKFFGFVSSRQSGWSHFSLAELRQVSKDFEDLEVIRFSPPGVTLAQALSSSKR